MEQLLIDLGEKSDADVVQGTDALDLEWTSPEAVRQANKVYKVFGEPSYVNKSPGGSVNWFDISRPMAFSQITVEDAPPCGILNGRKSYSSFTVLMRLTRAVLKGVPADLATYNHNSGKLICHAEKWKEAVVIATAVNLKDTGFLEDVTEVWKAWKNVKDPAPFVKFLIGEEEPEDDEEVEEIEEKESPVPIKAVKKSLIPIPPIEKSTPEEKRETPKVPKEPKVTKEPTPPVPVQVKKETPKINKTIKSPGGRPPRGKTRVASPTRSPIKTIMGSNRSASANIPPGLANALGRNKKV